MEARRSETSSILRNIDWPTVLIYIAMVICGVFSIYAASYDFDEATYIRQVALANLKKSSI